MSVRFASAIVVSIVAAGALAGCSNCCRPRCCPPAGPGVVMVGPAAPVPTPPVPPPSKSEPGKNPAAGMSAEDRKKMEEEMMKLAQPGPEHERLKKFVGEWAVHGKFSFGGQDMEADSVASTKAILDGRYFAEEVHGTFQGMPFEGRATTGFDNVKKEFFSTWIDNMGTGLMVSHGKEIEPGKRWEWHGTMDMPEGPVASRQATHWTSDDEYVYEMWVTSPQGEMKVMELHYKRK
jgi:hypothetical protein